MNEPHTIPIQLRAAREAFSTWDGFLAFGFGSGLLPRAPGTWGTLLAVPLFLLLRGLPPLGFWLFLAAAFGVGAWLVERVSRRLGVVDYGGIVWDEMVGFWLAMAVAPPGWLWLLAGFGLFRFFDIIKPWPVNMVETHIGGGLGVMLDDVLAGLYTLVLLAGAAHVLGS